MVHNTRGRRALRGNKLALGGALCLLLMGLSPVATAGEATKTAGHDDEIREIRAKITELQSQLNLLTRRLDGLTKSGSKGSVSDRDVISRPNSPTPRPAPATTTVNASKPAYSFTYDDKGLIFRSSDGNFSLRSFIGFHEQFVGFNGNARENTTFSIRRIRPEFRGTIYNTIKYNFGFDLASGRALLQNAYIDYLGFSKYTYIRLGQFKTPFGRETYEFSRLSQPFIERSNLFALTDIRNIGIGLGGRVANRLKWDVAVVNGNGINLSNARNNNDSPDFAGRARVNITKTLSVGGSLRIGNQPLNMRGADTKTTVTTDSLLIFGGSLPSEAVPPGTTATQGLRVRLGGDFRWEFNVGAKPAFIQGEYLREAQEREDIPVDNMIVPKLPDLIRQGFMVQGGAFVAGGESRGLQLIGRFDMMDIDDENDPLLAAGHPVEPGQIFGNPFNILGNRLNTVTLGMNYWFNKRTRFQFNYYIQDLDHATTLNGGVGLSRAGVSSYFLMQVQTVF